MRSTKEQMRELLQSSVWRDMLDELEVWEDAAIKGPYVKGEGVTDQDQIYEFFRGQGRVEAINYIKELPETLLQALQFDEEESKDGPGRDET